MFSFHGDGEIVRKEYGNILDIRQCFDWASKAKWNRDLVPFTVSSCSSMFPIVNLSFSALAITVVKSACFTDTFLHCRRTTHSPVSLTLLQHLK